MGMADAAQLTLRHLPGGEPDGGIILLAVASGVLGVGFVLGCIAYGPSFRDRSSPLWDWSRSGVWIASVGGTVVAAVGAVWHFS
jgi:hypothetical protein